ncbi:MAG: HAD-IA family hydrolase [Clostridia bacterium]|nr:HAD-IA family hydrolase [Clostridia bacterium]
MIREIKNKKVIFFDVGYTLDRPASGDWMFTGKFLELADAKLKLHDDAKIAAARDAGLRYLEENHLVTSLEDESRQFYRYYSIISEQLGLGLTGDELEQAARDRTFNMENYIPYPGIREVLETLGRTHKLGIISDTWPSIEQQLEYIGVAQYFSFRTYSCFVGVFKPDRRMFLDALGKCGAAPEETVFIDDSVRNLEGAAALGITPILIAANPAADVETSYLKIRDLRELIRPEEKEGRE